MKIIGIVTLQTKSKHILTASYFRIGVEFINVEKDDFDSWLKEYLKKHEADFFILKKLVYERVIESLFIKIVVYYKTLHEDGLKYACFLYPVDMFDNEEELEKLINSVKIFMKNVEMVGLEPRFDEVRALYDKELKTFEGLKC